MQRFPAAKRNSFIYISDNEGHSFRINKTKGEILYMECRTEGCPVHLVYNKQENVITKQSNVHNHVKNDLLVETLKMRSFLREKAESSNEKFENIFLEAENFFPAAASAKGNVNYYLADTAIRKHLKIS